ncbi:hypothetical protein A8B82_01030 [Sulfitobacter sp. EhC04]|uniref:hypothetical protein n=1 Tax=Sulfitobacter sp. EhC04 TaxID=1849168 RepID=UPI0007F332DE|nr:hypothetical protein [Sulfitobacter sp. EhC04]OAN80658.1 hypothetical protein A8B82_01030 [Sulfitobacter sp. EhC04]
MDFAETYRHEVIQSRRDRSRRALFWSRIVGILLVLTIAAILRVEPELRRALAIAGSDAIIAVMGRSTPDTAQAALPQGAQGTQIQVSARPRDRVKVNRPGQTPTAQPESAGQVDPQALAREIEKQFQNLNPRP